MEASVFFSYRNKITHLPSMFCSTKIGCGVTGILEEFSSSCHQGKICSWKKTYISTNAVMLININLSELDGKIFLFKLVGTLSTKLLTGVSQVWPATSNKLMVN